jgi:hypothetical protein
MPRPRKTPLPDDETPATPAELNPEGADGADGLPVRRRRRRRTAAQIAEQQGGETALLVDAVLRSRGGRGATPDMLQNVVTWARTVRAEGDALRELSGRPRRQKTQAPMERVARFELNRALLDGVLQGTVALDVNDDGTLQFFHGGAVSSERGGMTAAADDPAAEATEGTPT